MIYFSVRKSIKLPNIATKSLINEGSLYERSFYCNEYSLGSLSEHSPLPGGATGDLRGVLRSALGALLALLALLATFGNGFQRGHLTPTHMKLLVASAPCAWKRSIISNHDRE